MRLYERACLYPWEMSLIPASWKPNRKTWQIHVIKLHFLAISLPEIQG